MKSDSMSNLKQELETIRDIIENYSVYDVDAENNISFTLGADYLVLLSTGQYFHIVFGSNTFPNIDFSNITYIRKRKFQDVCCDAPEYVDTEIGEFDSESPFFDDTELFKKFNICVDKEIETGCYD
jgi:hypothetical protein